MYSDKFYVPGCWLRGVGGVQVRAVRQDARNTIGPSAVQYRDLQTYPMC